MVQQESIKIWIDGAQDALDTCDTLFEAKRYHHALFFLQLALEKILKGLYVSKKDDAAPYSHNLVDLAQRLGLTITNEDYEKMAEISEFNVSARYESHKHKIYKKATEEFTKNWIAIGKKFYIDFSKQL